jgi:transcriptional regulator with XRE-family HTH domain
MKKPKKKAAKKGKEDSSVYLKKLGNRLKQIRIKKGYSNYEYFAFDNNIGRAQYGKYETGGNIRFDTLVKIIKIHGMTIKEFFSEGFD